MYNTSAEFPPLLLRSFLYSLLLELGSVAGVTGTGSHLSNQTTVARLWVVRVSPLRNILYNDETTRQPLPPAPSTCVITALAAIIVRFRSFAPLLYFDYHRSDVPIRQHYKYLRIVGLTSASRVLYTLTLLRDS